MPGVARAATRVRPLSAGRIYVQTLRTCADRAGFLLALGVLVFVPLGFLSALVDRAGSIHVSHASDLGDLATAGIIGGFIAQAVTSLLGEVFYSGAVALTLARSTPPSLREVARSLSYGRLIAVDIVFGFAVAVGLLFLLVPGVVIFTWFAPAGPLVEIEDQPVRSAFRRSRQLVRGHFWTILAVLWPITLATEAIADGALQFAHDLIPDPLLSDWLGEAAANALFSPFYAVAAVLITLELSGRAGAGVPHAERVTGAVSASR